MKTATAYLLVLCINKCKKQSKNGYRRRSCTSKTAKVHHLVRFVMYCFITTVAVAFYCARSDEIVHYKSDETVNFCSFTCATTSPITVLINLVFYIYICCFLLPKLGACNISYS